ncbi:MAG: hypothetical protein ACKO1T_09435 [Sediminibacterium sp.]
MITLSNGHIIIDQQLATTLLEAENNKIAWVYYAEKNLMMLASHKDDLFKSIHKVSVSILKLKNGQGDRSFSLQELLIDKELNDTDRVLKYIADEKMRIVTVYF